MAADGAEPEVDEQPDAATRINGPTSPPYSDPRFTMTSRLFPRVTAVAP
jgi:hypothetical protein